MGKVGGLSTGINGDNYTPIVLLGSGVRVYKANGKLSTASGTWSSVGGWSTAIGCPVFDEASSSYCLRTAGVVRGESGKWYAMVLTGNGYPTTDGYRPSWATSPDGKVWTYHGHIMIDGYFPGGQPDSNNLIVNESITAIDNVDPANNRYLWFAPYYSGTTMALVYGNDSEWHFYRDGSGHIVDILGPQYVGCAFPAAVQDPYGYHLMCADWFDRGGGQGASGDIRHFWSCDALNWTQIEQRSDVTAAYKGTNLAYEPSTNLIHALTTGVHFTKPAQPYACP